MTEDDINAPVVVGFLRGLLRHLKGKVIVIWFGGGNHEGPAIRGLLERWPRLSLERLPGDAPDLNPAEMLQVELKHGQMANFAPAHVRGLERVVRAKFGSVRPNPKRIRSLWGGSDLPSPDRYFAIRGSTSTNRLCGTSSVNAGGVLVQCQCKEVDSTPRSVGSAIADRAFRYVEEVRNSGPYFYALPEHYAAS